MNTDTVKIFMLPHLTIGQKLIEFTDTLTLGTWDFLLEDDLSLFVFITPFDREAEELIAKYINKIYIE